MPHVFFVCLFFNFILSVLSRSFCLNALLSTLLKWKILNSKYKNAILLLHIILMIIKLWTWKKAFERAQCFFWINNTGHFSLKQEQRRSPHVQTALAGAEGHWAIKVHNSFKRFKIEPKNTEIKQKLHVPITGTRRLSAWETCTWPAMWQRKATGPQSHTSSRERHTMGENNVSTSTNTVELRISGAFFSEASLAAAISGIIWRQWELNTRNFFVLFPLRRFMASQSRGIETEIQVKQAAVTDITQGHNELRPSQNTNNHTPLQM